MQNIVNQTLTTFLTTILGPRRESVLEKCSEIVLFLLEARGNEGYAAQIAKHYGHGHKHYQELIQILSKEGIITVLPQISNFIPILLNEHVRVLLTKIVGGLAKSPNQPPQALGIDTNLSEFDSDIRSHRILSIFHHNLSERRFKRLKGKWSHNQTRCITYENSDNISDNILYTVQWFKDKLMIFGQTIFSSIEEASKVKDQLSVRIGSFAKHLEKKHHIELEFEENIYAPKNHQVKFEAESKDVISRLAAKKFKEAGHSSLEFPDFKYNKAYPGIEYIQGYKMDQDSREGYGPELFFNQLLHFPETFQEFHQEYKEGTSLVLTKLQELEETKEHELDRQLAREEKRDLILENMLLFITEKLASKDDIESIREDLVKLIPEKYSRLPEVKQLLSEGPKTPAMLAAAMGTTKPNVYYYLKQLQVESAGIIKKEGRGRPEKLYKLKGSEKI